jgi:hypothetical protein
MLQEGNYNVLEFNPPTQGMNCNIAPEVLPQAFASVLENILPTPVGSSMVRYGTKRLAGMTLPPDAVIMEAFPFVKANGDTQMVLYVQTFVQDLNADNFTVLSPNSFSFDTDNPEQFNVDTPIKIPYTSLGATTLYSTIVSTTVYENTVTITVQDNSFPLPITGVIINSVAFSQGSIYVYDLQTSTLNPVLKTGLSVGCVPRSVTFLNTLVICNGVDRVLSWDGTTLVEVVDFVKEDTAIKFNRINNTGFSFSLDPDKAAIFDITKYQNNNEIQLKINGVTSTTTIANIVKAENLITITTADNPPAFDPQHQPELFYRDWPPAFSFMLVAHNRLWGLGAGAVGLNYRDPNQALVVYFTYQPNTLTNWFDEKLKIVPFIDLAQTHGSPDNLEAIAYVSGLTIFLGRNKTQVWTGSEPLGAAVDPTRPRFEFSSILPIGIVHGNLVVEMANDVYFVSQNGLLSFSTLNVAKQFAATASDAVDPLVRQYVTSTTTSNQAYRACRSFKYKSGAFCGFKIGLNKVLVSLYSTNLYAWSLFSGDFAKAATFLATLDNALYLTVGNQIYQYADGTKDTPPVYGDNNGQDLINFLWTLPVVHLSGRRWANKRYELQVDYSSSVVLGKENTLSILIHGDLQRTFSLSDNYILPFKGDVLQTIPLVEIPDRRPPNYDRDQPDAGWFGFRLDEPYAYPKDRLKFLSSSFGVSLFGSTKNGKLYFKKIRLFGIAERSL